MNLKKTILSVVLGAAFFSNTVHAADIIIKNANVFDGTGSDLIKNAHVIIDDGKVKAVQTGKIKEKRIR